MQGHWQDADPYGVEHRLFPVLIAAFLLAAGTTLAGPSVPAPLPTVETSEVRPAQVEARDEDLVVMEVVDVVEPEEGALHVVLLMDRRSEYVLPIFLAAAEAEALRTGLLTEDGNPSPQVLLGEAIRNLGGEIRRVEVEIPADEPPRAWVVVGRGEEEFSLLARPGDALALALESRSPVLAHKTLVRDQGIPKERVKNAPNGLPSGLRAPANL